MKLSGELNELLIGKYYFMLCDWVEVEQDVVVIIVAKSIFNPSNKTKYKNISLQI